VAVILLFWGCGGDPEATVVDFSRKVAVKKPGKQQSDANVLRVAVGAMISPRETAAHYYALLGYISDKMGREVVLIQRRTYGQINELLSTGQVDVAFICSGPYATGKDIFNFQALAVPLVRNKHTYRSYLIVHKDSAYQDLSDLRGKVFAFTDPDSNTGALVPSYWLSRKGETPQSFFKKVVYTYSHDNSIMAVAMSLVDAASVHEQIWEYYSERNPVYTSKTRIIRKSDDFGNPLMVAGGHLSDALKETIREVLFSMNRNDEGKKLLEELMIQGFVAPNDQWYLPIVAMQQQCSRKGLQ
jgi:phosphonate transport system substrate-binding protein